MTTLQRLPGMGVSLWLDGLHRGQLVGGAFARLIRDCSITGVTTNPNTPFAAAEGDPRYDAGELAGARAHGSDPCTALRALSATDVRLACDDLQPVFSATGGADGYASISVDPGLSGDAAGTVADARDLTRLVDRPNVMVAIPATDEGLRALTRCLTEGISVNVTLIVGLYRYAQVIDAFMDGLETLRLAGGDVRAVASVASFVLDPVDVEVDRRLSGGPAGDAVRGRVAVAHGRLAYRLFSQSLGLPRWSALAAAGARPQRPVWTSMSDPDHVGALAAKDVVMTMPTTTVAALARTVATRDDPIEPRDVLAALADAGVDYDDVLATVERDATRAAAAEWHATVAPDPSGTTAL